MRRNLFLPALALSLGLLASSSPDVGAGIAQAESCDGDFHLVKRFTKGRKTGVASPVVSGDSLWLLQTFVDKQRDFRAFVKRWDGSDWSRVRVPNPEEGSYYFTSLDVTPDGNVWLAGRHETDQTAPVVLRWDGERWETTSMPPFALSSSVVSIDMWSAQEGWAVGEYEVDQTYRTLTLRWTGGAWVQVDSPGRRNAGLTSVSMGAPDDVWAIGSAKRPVAIRWDGEGWTRFPLPERKDRYLRLSDVDAVSPTEAWIAGAWERRRSASAVLSWDGSEWTNVPVKDRKGYDWLTGIDSGTGAWSVGERRTRSGVFPVALRRMGSSWVKAGADNPGRGGHLTDLFTTTEGTAWATGRASSRKLGLFGVLQKACLPS